MCFTRVSILSAFLAAFVASTPAAAQQAQRLRGEIEKMDGNTLTVKTSEGKDVKVMLDPNYTVSHAVAIKLSDIKPGTFVGVGSVPEGDGLKAAQVQVFAPESKASERHSTWGSDPNGMMTNAPATAIVVGQSDGKITLTANGQNHEITVPPDAPVVRTEAGTKDMVKPGAWIGISNAVDQNGVLLAKAVTVSDDRRYPAR